VKFLCSCEDSSSEYQRLILLMRQKNNVKASAVMTATSNTVVCCVCQWLFAKIAVVEDLVGKSWKRLKNMLTGGQVHDFNNDRCSVCVW